MTMDEITTYMPNLYNFLETYWGDGWVENQTYPDGNIYSMPGGKMHSRMHVTQGIQYINTQWLDNLGLEMPTTWTSSTRCSARSATRTPTATATQRRNPVRLCDRLFLVADERGRGVGPAALPLRQSTTLGRRGQCQRRGHRGVRECIEYCICSVRKA